MYLFTFHVLVYILHVSGVQEKYLLLSFVIGRHGQTAPHKESLEHKYFQNGSQELGPTGQAQMFTVGRTLRERYKGVIEETFVPAEVAVFSSDEACCKSSAVSCLQGLYPASSEHFQDKVNIVPREKDNILSFSRVCDKYLRLKMDFLSSEIFSGVHKSLIQLFKYINDHINKTVVTSDLLCSASQLYERLLIEPLEIEPWAKRIHPNPLKYIATLNTYCTCFSAKACRLIAAPLLQQITTIIDAKLYNELSPVLILYLGYQRTLKVFLNSLNLDDQYPDFGDFCLFELYETSQGDVIVEVWYFSLEQGKFHFEIPGCGCPCHYEVLKKIIRKTLEMDWEKECSVD